MPIVVAVTRNGGGYKDIRNLRLLQHEETFTTQPQAAETAAAAAASASGTTNMAIVNSLLLRGI